jgi:hypothetical protein
LLGPGPVRPPTARHRVRVRNKFNPRVLEGAERQIRRLVTVLKTIDPHTPIFPPINSLGVTKIRLRLG